MSVIARICTYLALALSTTSAEPQVQQKLPASVQKEIAKMNKSCKDAGGRALQPTGLLTITDVTGDGRPDFVIDYGAFDCNGAASLFSGSGGSQVVVYIGTSEGQAKRAFVGGAFGVKVDKESKPSKLQIAVGGELCGQKITEDTPRSAYKTCWRSVVWNERDKRLEYAPLSQIQLIQ